MRFFFLFAGAMALNSVGFSADTSAPEPTAVAAPAADPTAADRLAEAQVLMQNMRFRDTMMKVFDSRKEAMARMIDQSAMRMPAGSATPDEIADYKRRMLDAWWGQMKPDETLQDMAKVYADLFTVDELRAIAGFYNTPAGQTLVAKTLDLQQKSGAILAARMQASMPVLQKLQKEFVDAHPAKPIPPAAPPHATEISGTPSVSPSEPSAPGH
jgi:hypothetical protein